MKQSRTLRYVLATLAAAAVVGPAAQASVFAGGARGTVPVDAGSVSNTPRQVLVRHQAFNRLYASSGTGGMTALGIQAWGERLNAQAKLFAASDKGGMTTQGIRAWGQRLEAEARAYQRSQAQRGGHAGPAVTPSVGQANGFDWGDAGIGAAVVLAIGLVGGSAFGAMRRVRKGELAL